MHTGGGKKEYKNYQPVTIINVLCTLFMMVLMERINVLRSESDHSKWFHVTHVYNYNI